MQEIKRICNGRVLVFQTNLNAYVSAMRIRVRHEEYNPRDLKYYQKCLNRCGYTEQDVIYRDVLAFPLSGGYQHRQLVPRNKSIERAVVKLDTGITRVCNALNITRIFGWRYLLTADQYDYKFHGWKVDKR